jgi:hypothetical protein
LRHALALTRFVVPEELCIYRVGTGIHGCEAAAVMSLLAGASARFIVPLLSFAVTFSTVQALAHFLLRIPSELPRAFAGHHVTRAVSNIKVLFMMARRCV